MLFRPNIEKLQQKGDADGLRKALGHSDAAVRSGAARALVSVAGRDAIKPLTAALRDEDESVRLAAAESLQGLHDPIRAPLPARVLKQLTEAWQSLSTKESPLTESDVPALCKALTHRKLRIRREAADALGELGDRRAVEPLLGALNDEQLGMRLDATQALAKLGDPRAVEPLTRVLNDPEESLREAAAKALGELGDARAVEPLGVALAREPGMFVPVDAIGALAKFAKRGEVGAVGPLLLAQDKAKSEWGWGGDQDLQYRVNDALAAWSSVESLLAVLQSEHPQARNWAAGQLGRLGGAQAVEPLIEALEYDDWAVRCNTVEALGKIGDSRAVEPIIGALADDASAVRAKAAEALAMIGDSRAVEPLIGMLEGPEGDATRTAAEALGELGDPRAVEPLIGALKRRGLDARQAFLALQKIGGPEAEEAISEGAAKIGDHVRVLVSGEVYAGMPGDRVEMGMGTVGEWRGTVVSVSAEGASVRCDGVEGEVEGEAPDVGAIREMTLTPHDASELPDHPGHWCFVIKH